jgi:hypothetical protein
MAGTVAGFALFAHDVDTSHTRPTAAQTRFPEKRRPEYDSWVDVWKPGDLTVSNPVMTSRPIDKPMARAQAHLAAGRYAEAVGAFRAVLAIDGAVVVARLGLADALVARGQRDAAVDGLVEAAEGAAEREQHDQALLLYDKALALDPGRVALHLDVAVVEHAMGRGQAAVARVEALAERTMSLGRTEEAAEMLRFIAAWDVDDPGDEVMLEELEPDDARTVIATNPLSRPRAAGPVPQAQTETVVCTTVLVRPDGSLWLGPEAGAPMVDEAELTVARAVSAPIVLDAIEEIDPDMVTRVASVRPPGSRAAHDTIPTRPRSLRITPPPRPVPSPRATQATAAARPSHRVPAPATVRQPVERAPVPAPPASSALVERLRQRAGLDAPSTAVASSAAPRAMRGTKAGTEPIIIRRPFLGRAGHDDEVTQRIRAPRPPRSATTG